MERIAITGVGSELQGVGRMSDGRAIFIPGALPGEIVTAEIQKDAGRFCTGRLLEVSEQSGERIEPDCQYYDRCGGCQCRHASERLALDMKRTRVYDAMTRIAGLDSPEVGETLACETPLRYRNKAEYPIQNGEIGMLDRSGKKIIPVEDCLLQKEGSLKVLRAARQRLTGMRLNGYLVTRVNRRGEIMVVFSTDAPAPKWLNELCKIEGVVSLYYCALKHRPAHALDGVCRHIWGKNTLEETLCGLSFQLSPQTFFQVNTLQAEKLYALALSAAQAERSGSLLDAYCGCGTITLAAARLAKRVLGVEIVPPAIEDARRNAEVNGLKENAEFLCADAGKEIPKLIQSGRRFDCVIVDPPRKGCDEALLDALSLAKPARVAYVSCDPGTLARDVKRLTQNGFRFVRAEPVDMFPGTAHVETVVLMSRVSE